MHQNEPLRSALSEETKSEAAHYIADRLTALADGRDRNDPETWQAVAEENGCRVHTYVVPGAGRGEYAPMDTDAGRGLIAINLAYEAREIVRVFVHELAHHALWIWRPVLLPDGADGFQYEGSPMSERHEIARLVEALVFA